MSIKNRLGIKQQEIVTEDVPWTCHDCSTLNSHTTANCLSCGTLREGLFPTNDTDWTCCRCDASNTPSRQDCANCQLSRRLSGRLNDKSKLGKWNCLNCGAQVKKNRTDCFKCKTPRSGELVVTPSERSKKWTCLSCRTKNHGRRPDCHKCHTPRNNTVPAGEHYLPWRCFSCETVNSGERIVCGKCDDHFEADDFDGETFRAGDWRCSACSFVNFARRTECLRCQKVKTSDTITIQGRDNALKTERKYLYTSNDGEKEWEPAISNEVWECIGCKTINDSSRESCLGCKSIREFSEIDPSIIDPIWSCQHCGTKNSSLTLMCSICKEQKSSETKGEWACSVCHIKNLQTNKHCIACKEGKQDDFENLCITIDNYERKPDVAETSNIRTALPTFSTLLNEPKIEDNVLCKVNNFQESKSNFEQPPAKRRKKRSHRTSEKYEKDSYSSWTCRYCTIDVHVDKGDCPRCGESREECSVVSEAVNKFIPPIFKSKKHNIVVTKSNAMIEEENKLHQMQNLSHDRPSSTTPLNPPDFKNQPYIDYQSQEGDHILYNDYRPQEEILDIPQHHSPEANQAINSTPKDRPYYDKNLPIPEQSSFNNGADPEIPEYNGHSYDERNDQCYDQGQSYDHRATGFSEDVDHNSNPARRRYLLASPPVEGVKTKEPSQSTSKAEDSEGYTCKCGNYNRISEKRCLLCGLKNEIIHDKMQKESSIRKRSLKHKHQNRHGPTKAQSSRGSAKRNRETAGTENLMSKSQTELIHQRGSKSNKDKQKGSESFWYCKLCNVANIDTSVTCFKCRKFKSEVVLEDTVTSLKKDIARVYISDIKAMMRDAKHTMSKFEDRSILSEVVDGYLSKMKKVLADPTIPYDMQEGRLLRKAKDACGNAINILTISDKDPGVLQAIYQKIVSLNQSLRCDDILSNDGEMNASRDWVCMKCQQHNPTKRSVCVMCKSTRSKDLLGVRYSNNVDSKPHLEHVTPQRVERPADIQRLNSAVPVDQLRQSSRGKGNADQYSQSHREMSEIAPADQLRQSSRGKGNADQYSQSHREMSEIAPADQLRQSSRRKGNADQYSQSHREMSEIAPADQLRQSSRGKGNADQYSQSHREMSEIAPADQLRQSSRGKGNADQYRQSYTEMSEIAPADQLRQSSMGKGNAGQHRQSYKEMSEITPAVQFRQSSRGMGNDDQLRQSNGGAIGIAPADQLRQSSRGMGVYSADTLGGRYHPDLARNIDGEAYHS